jgi:hypothetical protein
VAFRPWRHTARNVLRDACARSVLIDWEWAGLYPAGYELAFLWSSLVNIPAGRAKVEVAVPAHYERGFLLSAVLVHLLHLQMWLTRPHPLAESHRATLAQLLEEVRGGDKHGDGRRLARQMGEHI